MKHGLHRNIPLSWGEDFPPEREQNILPERITKIPFRKVTSWEMTPNPGRGLIRCPVPGREKDLRIDDSIY